ncbi:MAG: DNA/RNA nuclease SfsA, partial [Nitrososphaerales archaeon]
MKPATLLTLQNLEPCRIIRRDTRFTVKVSLNGREELALLRNTGHLHDLIYQDAPALCTSRSHLGKTRYLLVGVSVAGSRSALIDPKIQCEAFEQASSRGLISWLREWRIDRREVAVEGSRIDYSIRSVTGEQGFLETKSAVH